MSASCKSVGSLARSETVWTTRPALFLCLQLVIFHPACDSVRVIKFKTEGLTFILINYVSIISAVICSSKTRCFPLNNGMQKAFNMFKLRKCSRKVIIFKLLLRRRKRKEGSLGCPAVAGAGARSGRSLGCPAVAGAMPESSKAAQGGKSKSAKINSKFECRSCGTSEAAVSASEETADETAQRDSATRQTAKQ